MKNINLPELIRRDKFGKNIIAQKLFDKQDFNTISVEVSGDYLLISNDKSEVICLAQKNKKKSNGFSKVLVTTKKPTVDNYFNADFIWSEYPRLKENFDPDNIRKTWTNAFSFKEENLEENILGLRAPQIAAIFNVLSHWKVDDDIGTVVMPTGIGKTETMLSLLIARKCERLLVVVPSDPLREQISNKFITLGHLQDEKFGIVSLMALKPIVGILYENFKTPQELKAFAEQCNVIVTTMDLLSAGSNALQIALNQSVSHIFIDEAHHVKAPTWLHFRSLCEKGKIIQFTATPFRNDGQNIDGKFVFNYSLKRAQQDGYFKPIELIQVNEWDNSKADSVIVEAAIKRLKSDLQKYDHILMARCNTQVKANAVFTLYEAYPEYKPVLIHTGLTKTEREEAKRKILSKESKIIVCVDMLGEGFDLPNLKIAAFHNIRKSLPITVQLAGRFTRTKFDEKLGDASIIVNLKDADVTKELEDFYALGADWNSLLPRVSTARIQKELDFNKFINGFSNLTDSKIPFESLKPALSTVVYKNHTDEWFPNNFNKGISGVEELDYLFSDINREQKTLVIVTGKKQNIDWAYSKELYDILWNLYVVHWDTKNNLLFINASDNAGNFMELAKAIIGDGAELINKINVFRAFHGIERIRLQNVGLKEFLGRNITFSMRTGYNIEEALELADKQSAEKAFVFGSGYKEGEKISIGCSYKGRVWSRRTGDILQLIEWMHSVGDKLIRDDIDPNTILKETLIPNSVSLRPKILPFAVDWNEDIFLEPEEKIVFDINGVETELYKTELCLINASENGDLLFALVTPDRNIILKQTLFNNSKYDDFKIERVDNANEKHTVHIGKRPYTLEDFFYRNPVIWWFVDGSSLCGNECVELKQLIPDYSQENILKKDWTGIDLSEESQGVEPKKTNSIQYKIISELKESDYDIVYDDDYSGEIADIITVKQFDDYITIQMYHLKFAKASVSQRIDDLYEVCGQTLKSINWKFKESKEFFEHMLRREVKKRKGKSCSRIEVGSKDKISYFKEIARKGYHLNFEIFIIQPGLSSTNPSAEQLSLLGVVDSYLRGKANISLTVIGS